MAENPIMWDFTSDLYQESEPANGVTYGLTEEERAGGFNYTRSVIQERISQRHKVPKRKPRSFFQGTRFLRPRAERGCNRVAEVSDTPSKG